MKEGDRLVLKIPQVISAQNIRRGGEHVGNETYLNAEMFADTFFKPATQVLGTQLAGMIFEQEYQRKQDRLPVKKLADDLEGFFASIPKDTRYHIELRTEVYLSTPVFKVMEKYGVGQVLSRWTWLPPLRKQLAKAGHRVFNSGREKIVRLMPPIGMRYEVAYAEAHPFDKLVVGMLQEDMVRDTADLIRKAIQANIQTNIFINSRARGQCTLDRSEGC